jgi:hypothetical protein
MMKGIGRSLNALVDKATSTLVSTSHLVHDCRGKTIYVSARLRPVVQKP